MWDLETIVRDNNAAALDAMMQSKQVSEIQAPMPEVWPLSLLAAKLRSGPPLLSEVINSLANVDTAARFSKLLDTFLPKHKKEIMAEPRDRRVYRFSYLFGQEYYPLPINTDCGIAALVESMPVELLAMSYSAYHNLRMRPGYLLLLSLVVYPYEGDERDLEDDSVPFEPGNTPTGAYRPKASDVEWLRGLVEPLAIGGEWIAPIGFTVVKVADNKIELREAKDTPEVKETIARTLVVAKKAKIEAEFNRDGLTSEEKLNGARVPLLDMVQGIVGAELAGRIPEDGWQPEELHQITDNTPYDGVGDFADWICSQTGCVIMDSNYEGCDYPEGYSEPLFRWTRHNVEILTAQWPKVQQLRGKIDHIVDWLEADQVGHFKVLLDFILDSNLERPKYPITHSYDSTQHWCELDQLYDEEDEEDDDDDDPWNPGI